MIINRKFIFALVLLFGILTQTKCGQVRGYAAAMNPLRIVGGSLGQVEASGLPAALGTATAATFNTNMPIDGVEIAEWAAV
jgi:hypothetical protein